MLDFKTANNFTDDEFNILKNKYKNFCKSSQTEPLIEKFSEIKEHKLINPNEFYNKQIEQLKNGNLDTSKMTYDDVQKIMNNMRPYDYYHTPSK